MAGPSGTTPVLKVPYPIPDDSVDVPRDIKALADWLEAGGPSPIGSVAMWLTPTPPAGWLLCQGQTNISATTFPQLAALLGQTAGMVNMPDLRDRFPVGAGVSMVLGATGGASSVTLSAAQSGVPAHHHADGTLAAASHAHSYGPSVKVPTNTIGFTRVNVTHGSGPFNNNFVAYSAAGTDGNDTATDSIGADVAGQTADVTAAAAAQSHENRPPYLGINFIIRAG